MKRTVLAIAVGFAVLVLSSSLIASVWPHQHWEDPKPPLALFVGVLGSLLGGYVAGLIGKRAPVAHAAGAYALVIALSLVQGLIKEEHRDWARWLVGSFALIPFVTEAALFMSWRHTGNGPSGATSLSRTVLAIGAGLSVSFCSCALAGASWSSPLDALLEVLGQSSAGYVAACIGREAPVAHSLGAAAAWVLVPLVAGAMTGVQRDWPQWTVGAFTATLYVAWGGLLKSWQASQAHSSHPAAVAW